MSKCRSNFYSRAVVCAISVTVVCASPGYSTVKSVWLVIPGFDCQLRDKVTKGEQYSSRGPEMAELFNIY